MRMSSGSTGAAGFAARAMILAAGRGERMRPLTDVAPKPLLEVCGKPLMQWPMEALANGGFNKVVINTAWLGQMIAARFGDHPQIGNAAMSIRYSDEGADFGCALETAGGIARALPLLDEVFWVTAGDVYMPAFAFTQDAYQRFAASGKLAHIWLVPNPPHNPKGDFGLSPAGLALNEAQVRHTFSTVAIYRKTFFASLPYGNAEGAKASLAPLLRAAMATGQVSAQLYGGAWTDVGTPERLAELNVPS
ncbi:nucleotidyltransferase family protein [soil metagenome]